ncbi:50S ribosomal protein L17 [Phanerochaete sordida]|uniref:50S ribosomal protein L17 n=1 Tax=Phanerochaete sordida TaxID=48140 RepID=A0A9P3G247_9APHY|nr:50S ribosomal protein L17 [Phanerochaete sordida]
MKHGVAFRKFSRTSSHRMLMLRNLVTSLIKHEQIKTTLPKARDTARLAEKIITMGKKGGLPAYQRANAFLLEPKLTPKVFKDLAKRYEARQGGYTRIHKFGNRQGDNAPHAILELVDNPRDIKFEMTARAVGWELLGKKVTTLGPQESLERGVDGVQKIVEHEQVLGPQDKGLLREKTRWSLQKVLRFRGKDAVTELRKKAEDHIDTLIAQPIAMKERAQAEDEEDPETPLAGRKALRLKAGQALPGTGLSAMRLAQGALGKEPEGRSWFGRRKLGIDTTAVWGSI